MEVVTEFNHLKVWTS